MQLGTWCLLGKCLGTQTTILDVVSLQHLLIMLSRKMSRSVLEIASDDTILCIIQFSGTSYVSGLIRGLDDLNGLLIMHKPTART